MGHVVPGGFIPWRQLRLGCHPSGLFEQLQRLPRFNQRELALDMQHEAKAIEGCPDEEYEPWIEMHIRRERQWADIAHYLHDTEPAAFTAILFDGVDKIQHLCWRFVQPDAPASSDWERRVRDKCRQYFRELDVLIGELVDAFGDSATTIVASDHGFGPQVRTFFVNSWLEQHGYLAWRDGAAPAADNATGLGVGQLARHVYQLDWSRTRAYAPLPSGNGIHIVRQDEAHPGGVAEGDYQTFRERLAAQLLEIVDPDSGERVVHRVSTREQLFRGPHIDLAPDLTLELQDGGLISIMASPEVVRRRPVPTGTHRPDGVFVTAGPEIRRGVRLERRSILDVAPLMLHALHLPIPSALEGNLPLDAIEPDALVQRPPRHVDLRVASADSLAPGELDAEAEAEILKRLQALGYVE
jgi:predicted AlkP superfamily phosphohydrolase/phosphomutase